MKRLEGCIPVGFPFALPAAEAALPQAGVFRQGQILLPSGGENVPGGGPLPTQITGEGGVEADPGSLHARTQLLGGGNAFLGQGCVAPALGAVGGVEQGLSVSGEINGDSHRGSYFRVFLSVYLFFAPLASRMAEFVLPAQKRRLEFGKNAG